MFRACSFLPVCFFVSNTARISTYEEWVFAIHPPTLGILLAIIKVNRAQGNNWRGDENNKLMLVSV